MKIDRYILRGVDGYMLLGVWQALNCLSIRAIYCVIIAGASPGETKVWAAVLENSDILPEDIVRQNPAGIFVEN